MKCPNCGSPMMGDGYTEVIHCERLSVLDICAEPDANPIPCTPELTQVPHEPKDGDTLTPAQIADGWHYCREFDYLLTQGEIVKDGRCLCGLPTKRAR